MQALGIAIPVPPKRRRSFGFRRECAGSYWPSGRAVAPFPRKMAGGDPRCLRDDPYLACALSAQADFIVSRDQDLLEMGKPFGIEILTPRSLLSRLAR